MGLRTALGLRAKRYEEIATAQGIAHCNICGATEFRDRGWRQKIQCKGCGSVERTRVLKLTLDKLDVLKPGSRVLHFAPERGIAEFVRDRVGEENYDARDLFPELYPHINAKKFDLVHDVQGLPSKVYDVIIHNHVMEHLPCNITAVLFHLHRALTDDGVHLFSVPIMPGFYEESVFPISEAEREKRFGQNDHVRRFGLEDLDRSIGMIFRLPGHYRLEDLARADELDAANIPTRVRNGFTSSTVFVMKKNDILLRG